MTKKWTFLLALMAAVGCSQPGKFQIEGQITDAQDKVLYLEHLTLGEGVKVMDSVRLDEGGHFNFYGDTIGNPEFYRLRIEGEAINLAIDSTETVGIQASFKNMSFGYTVKNSGVCDTIRMLSQKLADLERNVLRLAKNNQYTIAEREELLDKAIQAYKDEVKMEFIHNNYGATYSYFACFQMLGGQLIFNPMTDKSDLTWMRAVANAWTEKYPGSQRTINLGNIVNQGRHRQVKPREIVLNVDESKIRELGIIDMTFPDIKGVDQTLSNQKGKVVLLDFMAFGTKGSSERTLQLRELYNKFHARGFEIYQVSVDPDYHFWTQRSEHLPWISVYCEEGLNSDIVQLYQVHYLPTFFLIDRQCDLQARMEDIKDLEAAIEKLL